MMMLTALRYSSLLYACLLLSLAAAATDSENCGDNPSSSATEIHGCNLKLQEHHACSFEDTLVRPTEGDTSSVGLEYHACTVRSEHEDECSPSESVVVYGNALVELDDMLVQRQGEQLCFLWDHNDGNAPTDDCRADCVDIETHRGKEATIHTDTVAGLPSYGSVTRNRHVTISGASGTKVVLPLLVGLLSLWQLA